jgi:beta-lactamase class A
LEASIQARLDALEGDFAVAFKNVQDSSEVILINEREMFHAASTMKTPVMIELFKQAEQGQFSLDDSILVKNEFRSIVDSSRYQMDISEDSEGELYKLIGEKRTVRDLINDMITMSSNLATNILIEKVGAQNVTQTMRSYGADSILVLRGVEDIKAYEMGLSNRTTAFDEMVVYEKLARTEWVSKAASQAMIEILKQQHFNEMIPALLPEGVEVAHKTGWITGVHHDAGIVLLPDGRRYVLVLLSKNAPNRENVIQTFADISRMVYDYVSNG